MTMCGLAAFFEAGREFPAELLDGADGDLFHRGPDSGGRLSEPGWAFVFRRLSILDTRTEADQPMTDAQAGVSLIHNGEIYNYRELRSELQSAGYQFRSTGDTEVLLKGYLHWGEAVVNRLEGMYAFVVVDRKRGIAMAARDPFGIKPLYMRQVGATIGFASEMRPLLRMGPVTPDSQALSELLEFTWAAGSLSNVNEISWVEPGTLVSVSLAGGAPVTRKFFDILNTLEPGTSPIQNEALAVGEIEESLRSSLRAHLTSDVGYTVQLSGGVDSSLLTAFAAEETERELASFAVDLGNYEHNEKRWRDMMVGDLRLDHHEVALSGGEFADALPHAVDHMEGPVPHGGCVMLLLLCREIRKRSKVVITGEGGDEMFGGYARYGNWNKMRWQERIGRMVPRWAMPDVWPFRGMRHFAGVDAVARSSIYRDPVPLRKLFPALGFAEGDREQVSRRFGCFRDRIYAVDQTSYLGSLLARQDKMAMAASVEARVPFVHLPVLKLVNRLSHALRTPGGVTKPLLKRVADSYLPRELVHRRKVGLLLPYPAWARDEAALGRYLDQLANGQLSQYSQSGAIKRAVEEFRAGSERHADYIFRLINVELWLDSLKRQQLERPAAI